jgi:integrase
VPDVCDDDGRVTTPGEERRLLAAAGPWLKNLIIAAPDTGCRRGELLSLQWKDVDLTRRTITIRGEKAKTRQARFLPISDRLAGVLELLRHDPTGHPPPGVAFVFGDAIGRPVKDPRKAWEICALRAAGYAPTWARSSNRLDAEARGRLRAIDLHFHDLRHEAGSRSSNAAGPRITCRPPSDTQT